MKTIEKINNANYVIKTDNITVKTMFNMWKIWLTKKEIANIYGVKKSEIKKQLKTMISNSNLDLVANIQKVFNDKKGKVETFYSLDTLLLLWYKSKHFEETKFLVTTNNLVKEYAESREHRTHSFRAKSVIKSFLNSFIHA